MKKNLLSLVLPLLLMVSCSEPVVNTFGNIAGTVTDANTLAPLAGVSVKVSPLGYSQVTGNDGAFQFDNLEVQEYTLSFTRAGYEPHEEKVSVKPGVSSSIQVTMRVATVSVPTLYLTSPTNITKTSAKLHAMLSSIGNSQVTQHGFCYGKNRNPSTSDNTAALGAATAVGPFSADVTGLEQNTTYYIRAFATNSAGTAYSEEMTFATLDDNQGNTTTGIAVPSGLKLYYTFDGGDCSDATDYENDGIPINNPTYITDTPNGQGKAVFINGNENKKQYININYNVFKGLTSYSVAFWINDFTTGAIISGINPSKENNDYYQNSHWPKLFMRNDGKVSFDAEGKYYDFHDDSPKFSYSYAAIQSSGWHHMAVAYDGNVAYLYVDGSLMDNVNLSWRNPTNITKVNIGGDGNGCFPVYPSMKLDNFRVYSRCLSAADVKAIYDAEK